VAFSPDGTRLATVGNDGAAIVWDIASGEERSRFTGHDGDVFAVAFSPSGTRLATAGRDRLVRVWDLASQVPIITLTRSEGTRGLRLSSSAWPMPFPQLPCRSAPRAISCIRLMHR